MNNKSIGFLLSALFLVITFTLILLQVDVRKKHHISSKNGNIKPHTISAQGLIQGGKFAQASHTLQQDLSNFSENPSFIEIYGRSLILNNQYPKALDLLSTAHLKFLHNDNIRFLLAQAHYLSGNTKTCYETLTKHVNNNSPNYLKFKSLSSPYHLETQQHLDQLKRRDLLKSIFDPSTLDLSPNKNLIQKYLKEHE